ncbi:hypothetical protein [Planomonospora venezuelensis]|uniref:Uncharacterized protein n=1 Tax=Planomonospora venezuelensis TaxID=1999 RepID=A0A841D7B8_PLAVE|nr:hypothetical protein [Planomonospora venezuelensis]MBB5964394.1 hypothetical protein [Planomonospora venezuelensis]GIN02011.1 hypothetical protein Pve01_36690 [Planomonospora venezuelensis]
MREARAEDARTEARRLIRDLLGEERPSAGALLREAAAVLGGDRVARCAELARGAPLTRRSAELASLAGLLVGTRELGAEWWERSGGGKRPAPDEVLRTATAVDPWTDLTVLEMLAAWIADDAADRAWGPPAAVTDLNSWQAEDRVELPRDAVPGRRIVVSFDAGGRLDAVVIRRPDDDLGSNLDFNSLRYSRPAEAQWSWGVAAGLGPHRLDGEDPDPYGAPVDAAAARTLRAWTLRHGATAEQAGPEWQVKGDVVAAIERVDWMWRSGEWFAWWRGVSALVDGDPAQLAARLEEIAAAP